MTEQVPQKTTPEQREELARLAREGFFGTGHFEKLQAGVRALLSDRDALAAECQRLRERAEVAEKALSNVVRREQNALYYEGMGCAAPEDRIQQEIGHELDLVREHGWDTGPEQARAALGVAPEPQ